MQGTITKKRRKDGTLSWGYVFYEGKDASGKWIQETKSGFKTKTEASNALRDALGDRTEIARESDTRTFSDVLQHWLKTHADVRLEKLTVKRYRDLAAYFEAVAGHKAMTSFRTVELEKTFIELQKHGGKDGRELSPKTIRNMASVVACVFDEAIREEIIEYNPMRSVRLPRIIKAESKVLEESQLEALIEGASGTPWLRMLLLLDANTGARRGELLAVTWADLDFERRVLQLTKSLGQTHDEIYVKTTKNRKARAVTLPENLLRELVAYRAKQARWAAEVGPAYRHDLNLVLANEVGDRLKPDSVSAKVSLLARRQGLEKGYSLHSFRHSHGSHLLSHGVSLVTVSKRLGHLNPHITAAIYAHSLTEDDHKAAEVLNEKMGSLGQVKNKC
ncbi:MAG: tyrosine-type recombinase/integrase [Bryobacteraceae bacterium]